MTQAASPDGYILSEIEVFGRGGPVPRPRPLAPSRRRPPRPRRRRWRLQRDSLVVGATARRSRRPASRTTTGCLRPCPAPCSPATSTPAPSPTRTSATTSSMISDSFFYADFWYRTEFTAPPSAPGRRVWLNFDGINWKADVFLNGEKLGRIEGGFMRGRFDVTRQARAGAAERARRPHREERDARQRQGEDLRAVPTRTAARSAPTTRPITPRSAGTGSRPSAAATPASGTTCTSPPAGR